MTPYRRNPAPKTTPQQTSERYAAVPRELIERPQWCAWKWLQPEGADEPRKVPINPKTDRRAKSDTPATWSTFAQAVKRMVRDCLPGVGFMFSDDGPYCGADFDDCRDPRTGEISPEVLAIVERFDTYTEVSPSGTGLKLISKGKMPGDGKGRNDHGKGYECYSQRRFFAITGQPLEGTPTTVELCQEALDWHIATNFKAKALRAKPSENTTPEPLACLDDQDVVSRALAAKNGEKFGQLYAGDKIDYPSDSEADQALCNMLAFWTRDRDQMDHIFRASGRMRAKWERADYRKGTIDTALKYVSERVGGNTARSSVITLCLVVLSSPPSISGEFRSLTADTCIAQNLGLLDSDTGEAACVTPGHADHQSMVFVSRNEDVLYKCLANGGATWTLPQVRASRAYGRETRIEDESTGDPMTIEHLVWRLLALSEAGRLEPLPIPHLGLPKSAPKAAKRVHRGLVLLLGLKKTRVAAATGNHALMALCRGLVRDE
jgi:putative DNA primase/helicase